METYLIGPGFKIMLPVDALGRPFLPRIGEKFVWNEVSYTVSDIIWQLADDLDSFPFGNIKVIVTL